MRVKDGEMWGACSIDGDMTESIKKFLGRFEMASVETSQETRPLGRPMIHGRIMLQWILRKLNVRQGCIHLAQGRVQWSVYATAVMNI
jgi:hypothetical protein